MSKSRMKKKERLDCSDLGARLCAYALSQQPQAKEEKRIRFSIYRQKRKRHRPPPAKRKTASKRSQGKSTQVDRLSSRLQMKALSLLMEIIFITTAARSHLMPSLVKS